MSRFRDLPIGRKLLSVNVLTSSVALLLAATTVLAWEVVGFRRGMVEELSMQASVIGYNVTSALRFDDREAATTTLAALGGVPDIAAARVYTRDGVPFATYVRGEGPTPVSLAWPIVPGGGESFEGNVLVLTADIAAEGEHVGSLRLVGDLTRMHARVRGYAVLLVVVFLAAAAAGMLMSARLQRTISDPILDLVDKARVVSEQKDYRVRAEPQGADELGLLVRTFNEMLAQIEARDRALEQARDAAEEANRAKDEFLAVVSHELRTPLTPILAWVGMLRGGRLDPDKRERALEVVERNARAQVQLVSDLLDVSRIVAGKVRLELDLLDPARVVEAAIDSARPAAEAKGVHLSSELETGARVAGDPERLQQVFLNLLSNAIKFTPHGGRVAVRLARAGMQVRAAVVDSGQGIRAAFLPHVFDRFRQADATSTRRHGGLGLGLFIVRHLVEAHGGRVVAASPGEGGGATFTVELPVATGVAPAARAADAATAAALAGGPAPDVLRGIRVLVVDDEPDTVDAISAVLREAGADVLAAPSTVEALQIVQGARPDVVVSDVAMPGEDGYALVRRLRMLAPSHGGRTPVLALTAFARAEDRARLLAAGFDMHAAKPVDPAQLVDAVRSLARTTRTTTTGGA